MIRFNRVNDIPIYILFHISNMTDQTNILKYTINGLKSIMKKFWYFESMNPSVDVSFNYMSEDIYATQCKKDILKQMFIGGVPGIPVPMIPMMLPVVPAIPADVEVN
jgi:hypothetical protein